MRISWCILLLLAAGIAHAASFDCSKAKTSMEKAVCSSPQLSAADEQMAATQRGARGGDNARGQAGRAREPALLEPQADR
jgi:uncharacterized protein